MSLFWVPFSESVSILVVLNLLGHDCSSSALVVVELNSVLANMRCFIITIVSGSNEVIAALCELTKSSLGQRINSHIDRILTFVFPLVVLVSLSEPFHLASIQSEFSHCHVLCRLSQGLEWPRVGWVIVSTIAECRAIDSVLEPVLVVVVFSDLLVAFFPRSRGLSPLEHLNSSHESVGICYGRSETLIDNIFSVFCGSHDVNQIVVVRFIDFFGVNGLALLSCCFDNLCVCYKLLLVLPEEDQREWDHHATKNETTYAPLVFTTAAGCSAGSYTARSLLDEP